VLRASGRSDGRVEHTSHDDPQTTGLDLGGADSVPGRGHVDEFGNVRPGAPAADHASRGFPPDPLAVHLEVLVGLHAAGDRRRGHCREVDGIPGAVVDPPSTEHRMLRGADQ
jgi:hypothetical protein